MQSKNVKNLVAVKFFFSLKPLNIKVLYELIVFGIEIAHIMSEQ
jgi:hypothetical protein